jgi:hypothetical protein
VGQTSGTASPRPGRRRRRHRQVAQNFTINLQNNSQYTFVCDVHPDTMRGAINIRTPGKAPLRRHRAGKPTTKHPGRAASTTRSPARSLPPSREQGGGF